MIFLDATTDIAFKKLFGTDTQKDILISFLNSVLQREPGKKIVDVIITDPSNKKDTPELKFSIVDARCTDETGKQYIIEMQAVNEYDYKQRAVYYASLALARQLNTKEPYAKLDPVIFIAVLGFNLFESLDYLSEILLLNKKTGEHALPILEFHFIELPKFHKKIEEVETIKSVIEKWIYLLKYSSELRTVPANFKDSAAIVHAFDILEQGNWSKADLSAYERFLDALRSEKSRIVTAHMEGEIQGEIKAKIEIAKNLLGVLDDAIIAAKTGLTIEEIQQLKHNR